MKKENKKGKKKIFKTLLKVGVTIVAVGTGLYIVNKYVPGFNRSVKEFAKNMASDVKNSVLKEEEKQKSENVKKFGKRFNREIVTNNGEPRKNFNDKMNRCGNKNNRRERFEKSRSFN